ncbi:hypothetical protein DQ354_19605 [Arthrobacter sp. AQ5-06]|nr:hypothetical protein DQ354_19605 [Arthrobacter sp. AQ5-06]
MKHKTLAAAIAMISMTGIAVAAAAPASARPLEHDHWTDSGSVIAQVEDPQFCAGIVDFPVLHDWNAKGMFLLIRHGDGLAYGGGSIRATDVWTNTLNGKNLTITVAGQDRDHKVIDNGDGTLTIEVAFLGVQKVYGPDGTRLFMDTGITKAEVLIDNGGTPADPSDDEFISFEVTASHGLSDTAERDFCADLVTFIG